MLSSANAFQERTFDFSDASLIFITPSTKTKQECEKNQSEFDNVFRQRWQHAVANGYTRYTLDHVRSRCLDGKYGFLCQFNDKRATDRRAPQSITSIDMPFNPDGFHFNRVNEREVLMCINPSWRKSRAEHFILVNASPFEFGNSLLVPSMRDCLPQVLKEDGVRLLFEVVLLSGNPAFRAGFNGLTAQASVNHFHFHVYYLNHSLYLENAEVRQLFANCYEIVGYPAQGFAFQITKLEDIADVTKSIMQLVNYFLRNSMAHNVYVTRGTNFQGTSGDNYDALRVYIWTRTAVSGQKEIPMKSFVAACIELAGHIPLKDVDAYESISEDQVITKLREMCTSNFERTKRDIRHILH